MSDTESPPELCEDHTWASVGVTVIEGTVNRIWECEYCPVWAAEALEEEYNIPWVETAVNELV